MQSRHALAKDVLLADQYRIDTVLGAGGFGITYMAQDTGLGSLVVLKEYFPAQIAVRDRTATVHPRSEREDAIYQWGRDRFVREARILDSCRHPHIVRVRRVFELNNTAYMALDFENGPSLDGWLKTLGRAPSQGEIDAILWPLLDALAYLHGLPQPVIHRDIAPDNIIMRDGNHPVLIDFGAARVETTDQAQSRVGAVKDGYSPREQYSTKAELQGPWTDIYAMAATMRRAITGERPPDSMGRDLDDTMEAMADIAPDGYRPEFLAAIDAAMRVQHGERPQTVAAWRSMLFEGVQDGPAVTRGIARSRPRSAPTRTVRVERPVLTDARLTSESAPPAATSGSGSRVLLLGLGGVVLLGIGMGMAHFLRTPAQIAANPAPAATAVQPATTVAPATTVSPGPTTAPAATPAPATAPPPAATVAVATPNAASAAFQLAETCRRLARPPEAGVVGVLWEDLDGAAASTACDAAVRANPENTRLETLLGRALAKTSNFGAARQWLDLAARKGDAYAIFHLGVLHAEGQGTRRDQAKAREHYEKAVALGEIHAITQLGLMYEQGRGGATDLVKAREHYERAASFDHPPAFNLLGLVHENGRGVPQDYVKARLSYERAAAAGYGNALNNLGVLHANGRGVPQDYAKAFEFYQQAAAKNHAVAINNLGHAYEHGRGVAQDYGKARELYERAAEAGNLNAMSNLGVLFATGKGVAQDYAAARGWYEKAVERGEATGMHNLALYLDQGRGGDRDAARSAKLLLQAARAGSTNALTVLAGPMSRWSPETLRSLQTQLQAAGHYKGAISGTWDAASQAAAKQYAESRT